MKLGLYDNAFAGVPLDEMLDRAEALGLDALEIGTGNYPIGGHLDLDLLHGSASERKAFLAKFKERGIEISALSQHGNPIGPDEDFASSCHDVWRKTVELANALEVPVVNGFSGCPGDPAGSKYPNWVTCSWPPEFAEILEWQWEEKVIPYWSVEEEFARANGVQVGIEMHPGFVVYNTETLMRLRNATGPALGANFDPSHLFWQGIDPVETIRELGQAGALFHVHAKDTYLDTGNIRRNGVLDTKSMTDIANRAWTFRTVGYGAGDKVWRDMISMMRAVGYDYVLSIEHEDGIASLDEGLRKGATFLRERLYHEPPLEMWWADQKPGYVPPIAAN